MQGHILGSTAYIEKWLLMYENVLIQIALRGVGVPCFRFISKPGGIDNEDLSTVEKVACYLQYTELPIDPRSSRPDPKDQCPRLFHGNTSKVMAFAHDFLIHAKDRHPTYIHFVNEIERITRHKYPEAYGLKYFYWPLWASFMFPDIYGEWRWYENIIFKGPITNINLER
ncbi:hypothetical protein DSO57_1024533 [Entomophthora muscae]|uniref:Uncharacterized protein n=1 Tax=Entomophthora muscae TaxID=34485 RepID=A0ACC2UC91_9FUNG|nr:hypothetical protein DSO57_1024533 [Entomophthora muscae]